MYYTLYSININVSIIIHYIERNMYVDVYNIIHKITVICVSPIMSIIYNTHGYIISNMCRDIYIYIYT